MTRVAFASPILLRYASKVVSASDPRCLSFHCRPVKVRNRTVCHMSSRPDRELSGNSAEDEALQKELQQKVKELFGSRQNISIDVETDSGVQFIVRRRAVEADMRQTKAAWSIITSVAIISVVAGVAFIALFYSGAVHGSDQSTSKYDMPTYGKSSYINPYELLEDERELQEARSFAEP